jgi:hypothetical protein
MASTHAIKPESQVLYKRSEVAEADVSDVALRNPTEKLPGIHSA